MGVRTARMVVERYVYIYIYIYTHTELSIYDKEIIAACTDKEIDGKKDR